MIFMKFRHLSIGTSNPDTTTKSEPFEKSCGNCRNLRKREEKVQRRYKSVKVSSLDAVDSEVLDETEVQSSRVGQRGEEVEEAS